MDNSDCDKKIVFLEDRPFFSKKGVLGDKVGNYPAEVLTISSDYTIPQDVSAIFLYLSNLNGEHLQFENIISSDLPVVLICDDCDAKDLFFFKNNMNIIHFENSINFFKNKTDIFTKCLDLVRSGEENLKLIKGIKKSNQEHSGIKQDLEKLVKERTQFIEDSKFEVDKRVSGLRQLIRFVKELSELVAVEELIVLIQREVKKFHRVKSSFLAYHNKGSQRNFIFFQGLNVISKKVYKPWNDSVRFRINDLEDSQYLANEFGRPFAKVLSIPLITTGKSDFKEKFQATLFFEHDLGEEDINSFIDFISERLQPLSIALDQILIELDLKKTSLLWEKTFDGISDPVAIVDSGYKLMRSNKAFNSFDGKSFCFSSFVGRDEKCLGCPIGQSALGKSVGEKTGEEVGQVRKNNNIFEVHSYPINLLSGEKATTFVNHYVDVTLAHELQGRIIQNEKVSAIGHLAGNIAHELNNPLTGIHSMAQILIAEKNCTPSLIDDLKEVETAAERCQKIINNLLFFSKSDDSQDREVDLNELIMKTLPLLKAAMRQFNCKLELKEANLSIMANPQLLQQVIFNLVNNSCQAMLTKGRGDVVIQTRTENKNAILAVIDTGVGIAEEDIKRVFEPFFTTKEEGQGTGLGLNMVKNIIESIGGKVCVKSEVGVGTSFEVTLPLSKREEL